MTYRPSELVAEIYRAGVADALLEQHAADSSGRCPRCLIAGGSSGRVRAPCNIFLLAAAARRLRPPDE